MTVEHFVSQIDEAKRELITSLNSQLHKLQSTQAPGQFSFTHYAGKEAKDLRLFRHLGVLRQGLSYNRPTWQQYEYTNGLLETAKLQPVGTGDPANEVPGSRTKIEPNGILFENFSQKELVAAGQVIQSVWSEIPTPLHQ